MLQENCNSTINSDLFNEFMISLREYNIDNNTPSNSLRILTINENITEYISNIIDLIADHNKAQLTRYNIYQPGPSTSDLTKLNHLGKTVYFPAPSCRAIYLFQPYSLSGYY